MALINCEECGKEISDKADLCVGCGAPIKKKERFISADSPDYIPVHNDPPKKRSVGKIILLVIAAGVAWNIFNSPKPTEEQIAKREAERVERQEALDYSFDCQDLIMETLKFPSTFKRVRHQKGTVNNDGKYYISVDFESKNELGNTIPSRGVCRQEGGEVFYEWTENR